MIPAGYDELFGYEEFFIWWYQPLMGTTVPMIKLQYIWLNTLNNTLRHELDLFSTMVDSCNKLSGCMLGLEGVQTPSSMVSCYQDVADDMAEATFKRMQRVSELSEEFKERLWCEM
ncbi:hypothetical protein HXW73_08385 [Halomonas sp. SH5A2]|nr:hypothetical protein HXW73_08385 [Halomonas sp. SH5A2]